MKVVVKTDEYTIYQKRNERYGVKDASRAWVNGDAKVAILLEHKLIQAPTAKAAPATEEEVAAPEAEAAEAAAGESAEAEAPAGEAGDAEAKSE